MSQLRTNPPRGCATLPALFFDAYRGAVGYLVGCLNDVARLSAGGIGPYVDVGQTRVVAAGYGKALLPVVGRILVPDDEGYKHVAMAARVRQRRFSLDDEASGRVQLGLIEAGLKLGISERLIGKRHVFAVPHCAGAMWDGKYMTFADQSFGNSELQAGLYQAKLNSSGSLVVEGKTPLPDPCGHSDVLVPFIVGHKNTPDNREQGFAVTGSNNSCLTNVDIWAYPAGGEPSYVIQAPDKVTYGTAVSIKE